MIDFSGTGVALVTPMKANGSIDKKGLRTLVNHVVKGVDYIVALGTTGEVATLDSDEKADVMEVIKQELAGRKPLVMGHGGNDTGKLISQMKSMEWNGVDAVLSVSPYYNKPSQAGIVAHFQAFADACPRPVILYNVPGRTSSNLSATTTVALARHPNIIGTKEASGNVEQCMAIAKDMPPGFFLISGDDLLTPPLISIGASGVISVLANAWPVEFSLMVKKCLNGHYAEAAKLWKPWIALNPLLYEEGNPVGIKQVLALMKLCEASVRLPLVPATAGLKERMAALL